MTTTTVTPDRQTVLDAIQAAARHHAQAALRQQKRRNLGALVLIAGACAAFAALTPSVDKVVGVAGLAVLAVCGLLLVTLRPSERAEAHADAARRLHRLLDAAPGLRTETLQAALAAAGGEACPPCPPATPGLAVPRAENG